MIVAISPHLDDALLSAGAWFSWHTGVHVVTMFAGQPENADDVLTRWDSVCGFSSARHAMEVRRHEDKRAASTLGATVQHVPLLDGQYRDEEPYPAGVLEEVVQAVVAELQPDLVLAPLGIVHTDHVAVGDACRRALAEYGGEVILYEELPYRVDAPGEAVHKVDRLEADWYAVETCPDAEAAAAAKARALAHYTSQLWALPRWTLYVPERFWSWLCDSDDLGPDEP